MPKRIEFEGQIHEFPDDFTDQEISKALSGSNSSSMNNEQPNEEKENPYGILKNSRSGIDVLRDVGAGVARGAQNLGSALLEGGEYITRKGAERLGRDLGNPVNVPKWNAREFAGLEGNNPIDLGKYIESKNPDAMSQMVGQYGPAILAGGPSILRQMLTQGGYAASQASPDEQNALGLLPYGRGGAAIEGAALGGLPLVKNALKSLPHLTQYGASRTLNKMGKLAKTKNINNLNIDPTLIEDIRQFLPNTKPYRKALDAAKQGNFNDLFKLQSDLGKHAHDYSKSFFSASERAHGREGLETRNALLSEMHKELESAGNKDISDLLKKGQHEYSRYMKFKPYRNAIRNALGVAAFSVIFPQNPLTKIGKKILFRNTQ